MNKLWDDELTDEDIIARIEELLRGKADGKGCTAEELDAYFPQEQGDDESASNQGGFS